MSARKPRAKKAAVEKIDSTPAPAPKKPRGRPPKAKKQEDENAMDLEEPVVAATKGKKRGRVELDPPAPAAQEEEPKAKKARSSKAKSSNLKIFDSGFVSPPASSPHSASFLFSRLEDVFDNYASPLKEGEEEESIEPKELSRFLSDLSISPTSLQALALAFELKAKRAGFFLKSEFMTGFTRHGADTIEKMRQKIATWTSQLPQKLHDVWKVTFLLSLFLFFALLFCVLSQLFPLLDLPAHFIFPLFAPPLIPPPLPPPFFLLLLVS